LNKRIAIIGGGASGLLCAIFCTRNGWHVDLFEQNDKCGKKILVSGNGRCNISNKNLILDKYLGTNPHFVAHALKTFDFTKFESFAASLGLLLDINEDGRAYPLSQEAKSVVGLFLAHAKELGVHIHTNQKITNPKELLVEYDALVIATGSEAASHLGGCDDGYKFAEGFGHSIIPTFPSLVQLHLISPILNKISGAKTEGEVTLFRNRQKDITTHGDILFTSYGISGFAILDISHHASFALSQFEEVEISLNLLPQFTPQALSTHISNLAKQRENFTLLEMLQGLLPSKIAIGLLEDSALDANIELKNIDTKIIKKIVHKLQNWRLSVSDTHGFRHAEVSGGGVSTDEINPKTFESKLQKNLYFCGEVLDVTGARGGYNFAFAWASAFVAAEAINTLLKTLSK
jgi:predicted Rossmann fold flavoprotein